MRDQINHSGTDDHEPCRNRRCAFAFFTLIFISRPWVTFKFRARERGKAGATTRPLWCLHTISFPPTVHTLHVQHFSSGSTQQKCVLKDLGRQTTQDHYLKVTDMTWCTTFIILRIFVFLWIHNLAISCKKEHFLNYAIPTKYSVSTYLSVLCLVSVEQQFALCKFAAAPYAAFQNCLKYIDGLYAVSCNIFSSQKYAAAPYAALQKFALHKYTKDSTLCRARIFIAEVRGWSLRGLRHRHRLGLLPKDSRTVPGKFASGTSSLSRFSPIACHFAIL